MKGILLLFSLLFLFSCSTNNFTKRKYTKGVYVEKRTNASSNKKKADETKYIVPKESRNRKIDVVEKLKENSERETQNLSILSNKAEDEIQEGSKDEELKINQKSGVEESQIEGRNENPNSIGEQRRLKKHSTILFVIGAMSLAIAPLAIVLDIIVLSSYSLAAIIVAVIFLALGITLFIIGGIKRSQYNKSKKSKSKEEENKNSENFRSIKTLSNTGLSMTIIGLVFLILIASIMQFWTWTFILAFPFVLIGFALSLASLIKIKNSKEEKEKLRKLKILNLVFLVIASLLILILIIGFFIF